MTTPTSADKQSTTAPASAPRFKLKSPRSLSRLKAMRQSATSARHTPQDQQRHPVPAVPRSSSPSPLSLPVVTPVPGPWQSPLDSLPCPISYNGETSGADAGPERSVGSEDLTTPRLAFLGEVRGGESSHSPQASSSSSAGLSRSSVDTTTNESDPLTASSADSFPSTSASSSHRHLKQSRIATSEPQSGGTVMMEGQLGRQACTPPKQSSSGRGHFSSPAGSAVRAMGRKLLRFRQSSANEPLTHPQSVSVGEPETPVIHQSESSQGASHPLTATTPRQSDFGIDIERSDNDVGIPQLPPLNNFGPSAEASKACHSDEVAGGLTSRPRPEISLSSNPARHCQDASPVRVRPDTSADGFELLDALDAVMMLGADEAEALLSSQGRSTGPATASSSARAFSTWPHATDDFALPRLLTEAQMAQLEEEERSSKPRNIFSRFSLSGRFHRQSRPTSTASSVSEDDYGGDEDARRSGNQDARGGSQSRQATGGEASTSVRHSNSSSASSRDARTSNDRRSTEARAIITPGPTPRRSMPGLDSPAKRSLYSCTLLKMYPQLAHVLIVSLYRGWPTSDDRGRGPVEILYPRSINSPARLQAAGRRGGTQLGVSGALITPRARESTIQVGQRLVIRKLKFYRLDREEIIEIGFFMKDYASHYISNDAVARAQATRPQVSPEALARPPGTEQAENDGRVSVSTFASDAGSTSSQTRAEGNQHGLALWAARKPFLERCVMTRGDIGTTFDVGDIIMDSARTTTVPIVDARSPKPGKISFSTQLRIQAGLAPAFSAPKPSPCPMRRPERAPRPVSKMPPPWVATRASADDLALRANCQAVSPEQQEQSTSPVPEVTQAHFDSVTKPTISHSTAERDIDEKIEDVASSEGKDAEHRRSCSQTSCSSTDESFQSAASSIHSDRDEQDEDDVPIADLFERRGSSLRKYGTGRSSSSTETLTAPQTSSASPPSSPPSRQMYRQNPLQAISPRDTPSQQQRLASDAGKGTARESHADASKGNSEPPHRNKGQVSDVFGPSQATNYSSKTTLKRLSHQLPARAAGNPSSQGASVDSIYGAFMLSSVSASSSQQNSGRSSSEARRSSETARRHSHQPTPSRPHMTRRAAYGEERTPPAAPSAQLAHHVNNSALMRSSNLSTRSSAFEVSHAQLTGTHTSATPRSARTTAPNGLPSRLSSSPFRASSSSPSPGIGHSASSQALGGAQSHRHASNDVQPHRGRAVQAGAGQQRTECRGGGSVAR